MPQRLDAITAAFTLADDPEIRLELLLDFANKLPPLPERFRAARDAGMHRVPECMTPVFLWVERENGHVGLFVDVAEEAPTVKGLLSILLHAYDGATAEEIANIPTDLVNRLHLSDQIRMQRAVGFSGVLGRIKRAAAQLQEIDAPHAARNGDAS